MVLTKIKTLKYPGANNCNHSKHNLSISKILDKHPYCISIDRVKVTIEVKYVDKNIIIRNSRKGTLPFTSFENDDGTHDVYKYHHHSINGVRATLLPNYFVIELNNIIIERYKDTTLSILKDVINDFTEMGFFNHPKSKHYTDPKDKSKRNKRLVKDTLSKMSFSEIEITIDWNPFLSGIINQEIVQSNNTLNNYKGTSTYYSNLRNNNGYTRGNSVLKWYDKCLEQYERYGIPIKNQEQHCFRLEFCFGKTIINNTLKINLADLINEDFYLLQKIKYPLYKYWNKLFISNLSSDAIIRLIKYIYSYHHCRKDISRINEWNIKTLSSALFGLIFNKPITINNFNNSYHPFISIDIPRVINKSYKSYMQIELEYREQKIMKTKKRSNENREFTIAKNKFYAKLKEAKKHGFSHPKADGLQKLFSSIEGIERRERELGLNQFLELVYTNKKEGVK